MSAALVIDTYCATHARILTFLQKLSDEQLHWRATPTTHTIAFHAWHVGRWADYFQACLPGMTPEMSRRLPPPVQIWQAEHLADGWGFSAALGYADTGMEMPDDLALSLPLPPKATLLGYLGRVFDLTERGVRVIDNQQFDSAEQPQPLTEGIWGESTVGDAIMTHLTHDNRHLGMMECLLGLQGEPGTATL